MAAAAAGIAGRTTKSPEGPEDPKRAGLDDSSSARVVSGGRVLYKVLAAVNVGLLLAMGLDKLAAKRGARRIPEMSLLLFAALGAAPGLWAGMILFHHKVSKPRFVFGAVVATIVAIALFVLLRRGG